MEHTTNYQLSQWSMEDRIRMEDFNSDNAKIDAALKTIANTVSAETAARKAAITELANRSRYVKLKEHTCAYDATTLYIYMNDIDWTQWDRLYLDVKLTGGGSLFFFNQDGTMENVGYMGCGRAGDHSWSKRVIFNVGYLADRALDVSCGEDHLSCPITYAQLVKVAFIGSNVMGKGAQYILWGEK